MKIEERKKKIEYQQCKAEIERKQELISMLEAMTILGKELPNEEYKNSLFYDIDTRCLGSSVPFMIDLAHETFYKLFYKFLPELLKDDFIIKVIEEEFLKPEINDYIQSIKEDKIRREKIKKEYHNMVASYRKFTYFVQKEEINLIEFFIKNNMYEILISLVTSERVSKKQKFDILVAVLKDSDESFNKLLKTVPSTYGIDECDIDRKESFTKVLFDNLNFLREESEDVQNYFKNIVISKCQGCMPETISDLAGDIVIKNLIKFRLVDIDEVYIPSDSGKMMTITEAAYMSGREYLMSYLCELLGYEKEDYQELTKTLSDEKQKKLTEAISTKTKVKEIHFKK